MSHETIYRSLFVQARGVLKKELLAIFDRSARPAILADGPKGDRRGQIKDTVSIRERPGAAKIVRSPAIGKAI